MTSGSGWRGMKIVNCLRKELTEEEIKDYDPKYWAFRKPLEELEE